VAETFLRKYMPLRDTMELSEEFLANNIVAALLARNGSAWTASVPTEIFMDYVLPYARCEPCPSTREHHFSLSTSGPWYRD
jgi:hypothetical protein